jgi:hypothetical protein
LLKIFGSTNARANFQGDGEALVSSTLKAIRRSIPYHSSSLSHLPLSYKCVDQIHDFKITLVVRQIQQILMAGSQVNHASQTLEKLNINPQVSFPDLLAEIRNKI